MQEQRILITPPLYIRCGNSVHQLHLHCVYDAGTAYTNYTLAVDTMQEQLTLITLLLCIQCGNSVHQLHPRCVYDAGTMYTHYIPDVNQMRDRCVSITPLTCTRSGLFNKLWPLIFFNNIPLMKI
jgi:hypothetical protein